MIRSLVTICGVLTLLMTLACGQKGPLFLPSVEPGGPAGSEPEVEAEPKPETDTEKPE